MRPYIFLFVLFFAAITSHAQSALSTNRAAAIDKAVLEVLAANGSPSASIAIVEKGKIAYVKAYKDARLNPQAAATPDMAYHIGSVTKQFTATAILMLVEQGKLSLDDPVSRFLPILTRAHEVTIRQLLSHTSGYQDYCPQDYTLSIWLKPTTTDFILDTWAKKSLDFDPGTRWQYSNTGYVIAGVIVEKASGMSLFAFFKKYIFEPLKMKSVVDFTAVDLQPDLPTPYTRNALGPLRQSRLEGKNWGFGAGELSMTASDLALWNIAMIERRLLRPESYAEMQREVLLKNGTGTNYGLGIAIIQKDERRVLRHGGEALGFTAENMIFPDDSAAISVLVNQDAVTTAGDIAKKIADIVFEQGGNQDAETNARRVLENLQHGKINRDQFTENWNAYFNEQVMADYAASLGPLGTPKEITQTRSGLRGGMTYRNFKVTFPSKVIAIWEYILPDGKIEQFVVLPSAS